MSSYYELQIKINPEMEDIISDICFENLPCEGVVLAEETYKDLEMISTTEGTLRVFLNPQDCNSAAVSESHVKKVLSEQRELLKSRGFSDEELGSWEFVYSEKENEDWSKKWKEKWDVTHVSDRITVVPDWIEYTPEHEDEVIIKLEPGCAFGTGTHATTQLCMKAIEKYMPENADIADIGMGSGILAICAKKFGANYAYGCDNDETVIDVAKENAIKNGVRLSPTNSQGGYSNELKDPTSKSKIHYLSQNDTQSFCSAGSQGEDNTTPPPEGGVEAQLPGWGHSQATQLETGCFFELNTADKIDRQFDFVLANILHNVLAEIMGDLKAIMKDDAYMVLSGILDEKKSVVLDAIKKHNLELIEEMHQNQWVALVVRK